MIKVFVSIVLTGLFISNVAHAQSPAAPTPLGVDGTLAKSLGADERGMRKYVLVILKTGPKRMPDGDDRKKMFQGHMDNINRLASEGKLALAGPSDGVDGWRGIFILATSEIEEAKKYVATDPVIINGEMVAEYHTLYASAALMVVNETHNRIAPH